MLDKWLTSYFIIFKTTWHLDFKLKRVLETIRVLYELKHELSQHAENYFLHYLCLSGIMVVQCKYSTSIGHLLFKNLDMLTSTQSLFKVNIHKVRDISTLGPTTWKCSYTNWSVKHCRLKLEGYIGHSIDCPTEGWSNE